MARVAHLQSVINKNKQFLSEARERRSVGRRPGNLTMTPPATPQSGLVSSAWSGKNQARLQLLDRSIEQNRERLGRQPGAQGSVNQSSHHNYRHRLPKPSVMTPFKSPALKKEGKK